MRSAPVRAALRSPLVASGVASFSTVEMAMLPTLRPDDTELSVIVSDWKLPMFPPALMIEFVTLSALNPSRFARRLVSWKSLSLAPAPVTPDVPTLSEAGLPGYESGIWLGLMAPAQTPRPVLEKLNAEVNKLLNSAEVRENWAKQGTTTMGMSIDQFDRFLRDEIVKWAKIVKLSGAKVD